MWRFVFLVLAAICMVFAAITGAIWHLGDQDINLFYLSLFFVIVAAIKPIPIRRHAGQ